MRFGFFLRRNMHMHEIAKGSGEIPRRRSGTAVQQAPLAPRCDAETTRCA